MEQYIAYYLKASTLPSPFYVGKTTLSRHSMRLVEHINEAKRIEACGVAGSLKANKIAKFLREGAEISLEIVATVSTEREVNAIEVALIYAHGRIDDGSGCLCNHSNGGEGVTGNILSDEARQRMSEAKMGHKLNVGRKRPDMVERFSKPVSAFNMTNGFVGSYSSATEAEKALGVDRRCISDVVRGRAKTAISKTTEIRYRFMPGNDPDNKPAEVYGDRPVGKHIEQYTLDGELVASFPSINAAKKATGLTGIWAAVNGKVTQSGGFIWKQIAIQKEVQ